jgi:hypothetical protein
MQSFGMLKRLVRIVTAGVYRVNDGVSVAEVIKRLMRRECDLGW